MKRGARFGAGGRNGRGEVQLRGGCSRVTPIAPASERPLALSSSLRCKSELQLLMRRKYRSGDRRRPRGACGFAEMLDGRVRGPTWARPPGGARGLWDAALPASQPLEGRVPQARLPGRNPEHQRWRLSLCGQTGPGCRAACLTARGVPEARRRGRRGVRGGG